MSAEAIAEPAPEEVASETSNANGSPKPSMGLHSPPDSNNAMKLDDSDDSELSDLEDPEPPSLDIPPLQKATDDAAAHDAPLESDTKAEAEEDEDIGEVLPDHWSGTVPVFRPDMRQFQDFKKFVRRM
jgi:hypothetical protein